MWVEFVVGSLLCSKKFLSRYTGFPLSSKSILSKFHIDLDTVDNTSHYADVHCQIRFVFHFDLHFLNLLGGISIKFLLVISMVYGTEWS